MHRVSTVLPFQLASKNYYFMKICTVSEVQGLWIFYGLRASNCDTILTLHDWLVRETDQEFVLSHDAKSNCVCVTISSYQKTRK